MSAAAPWSVKGIEPKAREIAKDLARRSGMTLGEWLNTMILEDDDDGVVPLSRRSHAAEVVDRRGRSRRVDDAYSGESDQMLHRLGGSIEAIAARLEASERRSTIAIQGVDQAVTGLVRRLENQDQQGVAYGRRIDDIADELREGHKRLRRFEQETGPKTAETFGKVETTMGALAGRLYDIEERQRSSVNELRHRMDGVEKVAGPGVGTDVLAQVGARLDAAQGRTSDALASLQRAFGELDQRMRATEMRASEPEGARFEKLAETLSRQVEGNRVEMMRRLDTAETENRIARIEQAVLAIGDQVKASEQRSAQAVDAMGREVLRIAQNLNGRVQTIETTGAAQVERLAGELSRKVEHDMGRYAQAVEQRMVSADDRHAVALEKLGGEITRISDRLSDRIAQSERRSAQALDDIAQRLNDSSSRIEQRYDRASGELAERMRLSEERTAGLLAEARDSIEQRGQATRRDVPLEMPDIEMRMPEPVMAAAATATETSPLIRPDWRSAAFPDADLDAGLDDWSTDAAGEDAAPFPSAFPGTFPGAMTPPVSARAVPEETVAEPVLRAPEPESTPVVASTPFGSRTALATSEPAVTPELSSFAGFGGADVSDALDATQTVVPTFDAGAYDAGADAFEGETDFVDPRAFRAAAAAGRASSTRSTIDAARAAMAQAPAAEPARAGFGLNLKRGGKSKLQERLDRQASRDGGTVRKALGASAVAALLVAGGTYGYSELTGQPLPGLTTGPASATGAPLALSLTTTDAVLAVPATAGDISEAATLYAQATEQLDGGEAAGVETLTRAANLGYAPAQLHLAGLYQTGQNGVTADLEESRLWARRAAEGGDPKGMHAFGMYLFDGVGGARNRPEALTWLRRAAERGLIDSQYNVARIYENGDEGIAPNASEAFKWYLIAARAGDSASEDAVDRLEPTVPAAARRTARAAADDFQVAPLA